MGEQMDGPLLPLQCAQPWAGFPAAGTGVLAQWEAISLLRKALVVLKARNNCL